jgi:hypothetical protein
LECKHCGEKFSDERAELGYDYCTRAACIAACRKPLNVVAVHVNKASDQYVLREHLDLPEHRPTGSGEPDWAAEPGGAVLGALPAPTRRAARAGRAETTLAAINELEAELDGALARETDPQRRNKLINDYNASLRQYDIRYRRIRQRR